MRNWSKVSMALAVAVAMAAACENATELDSPIGLYGGRLSGANVRPTPTTSTATGGMTIILTKNGAMVYNSIWSGLTGAATMAHIHGPADSNNVAGILIDFSALPAGSKSPVVNFAVNGTVSGEVNVQAAAAITATVSGDSLVKLLNAGQLYYDVHTAANAAGETRAQLQKR